ncbi:hypothetical protein HNY73_006489, partial [Argiope bruennichi]
MYFAEPGTLTQYVECCRNRAKHRQVSHGRCSL